MKLPNSEKLQEILKEAKRISKKLGQNYIGSEHLLMALTFVSDTAPFVVLQENGVTIQSIINILSQIPLAGGTFGTEKSKYTKSAESILELAGNEVKRLELTFCEFLYICFSLCQRFLRLMVIWLKILIIDCIVTPFYLKTTNGAYH